MKDYMMTLLDRFRIESPQEDTMAAEIESRLAALREKLNPQERKLLLRIVDAENAMRLESQLYGFISGFRLASGIHGELDELPRFSIVSEDQTGAHFTGEEMMDHD